MATEKKLSLEELRKRKATLEEEHKKLAAEEKRLLEEEASGVVARLIGELEPYLPYISDEQRKELASKLGFKKAGGASKRRVAKGEKTVKDVYRLPTGETWSGRGSKPPKPFQEYIAKHGMEGLKANCRIKDDETTAK